MSNPKITFVEPKVLEIKYPWNYVNIKNKYHNFIQQIEECGRICYQSFDKITDKSGLKFVENVIKRCHWSVTEFGTLDIKLKEDYLGDSDFEMLIEVLFKHSKIDWKNNIMHTSLREIYAFIENLKQYNDPLELDIFGYILKMIYLDRPIKEYQNNPIQVFHDILAQINDKNKFVEIDSETEDKNNIRFVTKFRGNLNFTHQLVRHRKPSYLQLSRRYVRIEDELEVIDPKYIYNFSDEEKEEWIKNLKSQVKLYKQLLKNHKPEVARIVLPTGIMTEIIVLEYLEGWDWIWRQRKSPKADIMMRTLMEHQCNLLKEKFNI